MKRGAIQTKQRNLKVHKLNKEMVINDVWRALPNERETIWECLWKNMYRCYNTTILFGNPDKSKASSFPSIAVNNYTSKPNFLLNAQDIYENVNWNCDDFL